MARRMMVADVVRLKHVTREAVLAAIHKGLLVAHMEVIDGHDRWLVEAASAKRWQPRLRPGVREVN